MQKTIIAMLLLSTVSQTTIAQTTKKCDKIIEACDKALEEKNNVIKLSDLTISSLRTQNGQLITEVEELRDSNSSVWKNPFIMILLGAGAASTAYLLLKK